MLEYYKPYIDDILSVQTEYIIDSFNRIYNDIVILSENNILIGDMNFSNIKIIIWDLDDTFCKGILSEGGITPIAENIKLVKKTFVYDTFHSIII